MKPKTRIQQQVLQLSKKLPPIMPAAREWGFDNCLYRKGFRTGRGIVCMECGQRDTLDWGESPTSICPHCGATLTIEDTRKRTNEQSAYYAVITAVEGFQVLRYFEITGSYKVGVPAQRDCREICQHWIQSNGKYEIVSLKHNYNWYCDSWGGSMEIRSKASPLEVASGMDKYNILPFRVYPHKKLIPEVKRNGFKSEFHCITPLSLLQMILLDPHAETLLKTGQISLLRKYSVSKSKIKDHWRSIRICLRNDYVIHDADVWLDYLDILQNLGLDTLNAKYVCPAYLTGEHDRLVEKQRAKWDREEEQKKREQSIKYEAKYKAARERFFGIKITDGQIEVMVLPSVRAVIEEGDALHHCVFTNGYYKKSDSLLLSARLAGERLETVEFSLKTMEVVQCRGMHNGNTEYHDTIVELVNKHKHLIHKHLIHK